MSYWASYHENLPSHHDFPAGAQVLDVGFGACTQLAAVEANGGVAYGVELDPDLVHAARARGFTNVQQAPAEGLPFPDGTFDGVICKVVTPYTDEAKAIAEWARVLRPGGTALVSYHGAGYYLRYLLDGDDWKHRVYAARALANTWVYRWTARRLPGFIGDTIYQAESRLARHYARAGLTVEAREHGRAFMGFPVFIFHRLRRATTPHTEPAG